MVGVPRRAVALAVAAVLALVADAARPAPPRLVLADGTPSDLAELAEETFATFVRAVPARTGCVGDVRLRGAWEHEHRASYDAAAREVVVRVPATAPQLRVSMVHELAHHLEAACPSHRATLRPAFLAAQGFAPDTGWSEGSTWSTTPSEQWATALVRVVLDARDPRAPIPLSDEAVAAVRRWVAGEADA